MKEYPSIYNVEPEAPPEFILGLDLGQAQDYTALAVLLIIEVPDQPHSYHAVHLERFRLGTTYPAIVDQVLERINTKPLHFAHTTLVVDATGVGRPVVDLFEQKGTRPIACTITGGVAEAGGGDSWSVPKRILVSNLQVLFGGKRLRFAEGLPEVPVLVNELMAFKVKITEAANDTYGAWREGIHDDLVLALALAAWWGEKQVGQGGFSVRYA